jgi:hypothetical protein
MFRGARIRARRANAVERVIALIEALMHPARAVAHFLKKIRNGLTASHLIPTAPPSDALAREVFLCAQQFVDTSEAAEPPNSSSYGPPAPSPACADLSKLERAAPPRMRRGATRCLLAGIRACRRDAGGPYCV